MDKFKEKTKKIFEKTSYILQAIITLIFGFFVFRVAIIKSAYDYFDKLSLIMTIIFGIAVLAFTIYHIWKDGKKIEKMFLNFSFLLGILYIVFLLPGQVPDEQVHMMKTYEISQGIFITPIKEDGTSSTTIPEEMINYNHNIMKNYAKVNESLSNDTDYGKTVEDISSAQGYSFILYIIPAIGMFIGRSLGLNLIVTVYFAQILNMIFFIVMGYFTIKKMPFGKIVLALFLLTPMFLQQATSFSADVFINSISLFFIAYLVNILVKEEKITNKELIIYCGLCILISVAKVAYMPLFLIGILLLFRKNISKKQKAIFVVLSIILALVFVFVEYKHSASYTSIPEHMAQYSKSINIDSSKQIEYVMSSPLKVATTFVRDWQSNGGMYLTDIFGQRLGWLDIQIPTIYVIGYIILMTYALLIEKNDKQLKIIDKIWILCICFGIVVGIQLAMYLSSTPVGANFVGGVQGRYFIPIFILPILCLCKKENFVKIKYAETIPIVLATIINIAVIANIYMSFK